MNARLSSENVNALWGSFLAEVLVRLGLKIAVISPGSRSAPLTWALARNPGIRCLPVLDERSAAFMALGIAKRSGGTVALVCTSGTAAANYLPAVIEAREGATPLLLLTADRPPELRECAAGQAIDQVKLFGNYPRWQIEMALPEARPESLRYLRQTLAHAWRRCLGPVPGPVHLNCPFREPLAPVRDRSVSKKLLQTAAGLIEGLVGFPDSGALPAVLSPSAANRLRDRFRASRRGMVVVGDGVAPGLETARSIGAIAGALHWPVLADVLSGLRDYAQSIPNLVVHYDALLASKKTLPAPDFVLQVGSLPTSKRLRQWLQSLDTEIVVAGFGDRDLDPLRNRTVAIPANLEAIAELAEEAGAGNGSPVPRANAEKWIEAERKASRRIDEALGRESVLFEGKVPWAIARGAPAGTAIFFASSMPVRDAEFFWPGGAAGRPIFANRGANGIDGTLSSAFGLAANEGCATIAVAGDLAFLHDTNALLNARAVLGSLTVVLVNNNGGGIFENLPISRFDPPFEEFFATPQEVDFGRLCAAYGIPHRRIRDWDDFDRAIRKKPRPGVRVLEVVTDRKRDTELRRRILAGPVPC